MFELAVKFILGSSLFVLILFVVQSIRLRWAAGMLLTFPALNGIALFMAPTKSTSLSASMLPMILVNGVLCIAFIWSIQHSSNFRTSKFGPAVLFWLGIALWFAAFSLGLEFPASFQVATILLYAVFAIATTWLLWRVRKPLTSAQSSKSPREFLKAWKGWLPRALIFVSILGGFAIVSYLGADSIAGRIGAAPVLPLYALYSIATSEHSVERLDTTIVTVLLGPIVAMSFVIVFSQAVYGLPFLTGLVALIVGWAICFGCIMGVAVALDALGRREPISHA
jgi:hypothetical protein